MLIHITFQLAFGSPLPSSFSALLRLKILDPNHLRDTLLAHRWTQAQLVEAGLVDEVVEHEKLLDRALERGREEGKKVGSGAWGSIKVSLSCALWMAYKG
jgi:enoyl-CoA hydratase/carnithine racemase